MAGHDDSAIFIYHLSFCYMTFHFNLYDKASENQHSKAVALLLVMSQQQYIQKYRMPDLYFQPKTAMTTKSVFGT